MWQTVYESTNLSDLRHDIPPLRADNKVTLEVSLSWTRDESFKCDRVYMSHLTWVILDIMLLLCAPRQQHGHSRRVSAMSRTWDETLECNRLYMSHLIWVILSMILLLFVPRQQHGNSRHVTNMPRTRDESFKCDTLLIWVTWPWSRHGFPPLRAVSTTQ